MLQVVFGIIYQTEYSLNASHMYPFVHTFVVLLYTAIILFIVGLFGARLAELLVLQIRFKERRRVYQNQLIHGEIEMEQSDLLV